MKVIKFVIISAALLFAVSCAQPLNDATVNKPNANAARSPETEKIAKTERPQKIADMMKDRGTQEEAKPVLKFIEPKVGETINGSTVKVKLELTGDLKGYQPGKDPATGMGNHIHVILDNQPYEAYYNLGQEFELRNVADGEHTLRVFASRPWHESYKNEGSFQMIKFTVKNGGADTAKPATTNSGEKMSNAAPAEGKDMQRSNAENIDAKKPILTYSRPKGDYSGADADAIMIDFWLTNAKLIGDGGEYKVRYSIDGGEPMFIEKWEPIWLKGWTSGKHSVKLELVDKDGNPVENGGFNSTTREINVVK